MSVDIWLRLRRLFSKRKRPKVEHVLAGYGKDEARSDSASRYPRERLDMVRGWVPEKPKRAWHRPRAGGRRRRWTDHRN